MSASSEDRGTISPVYSQSFIDAGIRSGKFILTDVGLEKRCSMCGDYWPADTEFFHVRDRSLSSGCRACIAEREAIKRGRQVRGSGQGVLEL